MSIKKRKDRDNKNGLNISTTNGKVARSHATTWSVKEGENCPFAGGCLEFCYSPKANRYPLVPKQRQENFDSSKKDDFVKNMVIAYNSHLWNLHRIHADGDFYNKKYVQKWLDIISQCPTKNFYAYTKSFLYFDLDMLPPNLLLIQSEGSTVDSKINYNHPVARVFKTTADLEKAGWHNCSHDDHEVFRAGNKIGLVMH